MLWVAKYFLFLQQLVWQTTQADCCINSLRLKGCNIIEKVMSPSCNSFLAHDLCSTLSVQFNLPLGGLFFFFFFFLVYLGPHLQHMEVPKLGVESELQLPAFNTATGMSDLSHVCDLHHSSRQYQIPNPLSEVRNQTYILMDTSQNCFLLSHDGSSQVDPLKR